MFDKVQCAWVEDRTAKGRAKRGSKLLWKKKGDNRFANKGFSLAVRFLVSLLVWNTCIFIALFKFCMLNESIGLPITGEQE